MTAPLATSPAPADLRGRPIAWWGMMLTVVTEATIFAGLLSAYFFLRAASPDWPQGGIEPPELARISLFTVLLLGSSVPVVLAEHAIRRGDQAGLRRWLAVAFVMGAVFLAHQLVEYVELHFGWRDNAYASAFYVITGLHGLHLFVGLVMSAVVQAKAWTGRFGPDRHLTVTLFAVYWHFVDAVWVFVFVSLYVSPGL